MTTVPIFSLRHSPETRRPTTSVAKPIIIPVTMLQVSTINTAVTSPAIASTKSAKSIFATLLSISRPTYMSAGAVA
ncbi:Uncharacterised protein [Salmonella enterica subsp. enterica serovar Bovismorbificans]|uniref:Uncharacterized protein n=1 Tax=Salmonella enterica subsp. enterica serovar Bovismorbificans TaxID=58097 RepID=A0A655E2W8_SALET|nr:Uncharacterised protein [Salmonella enterica subsp. enterica serovar Bovismorbificans]